MDRLGLSLAPVLGIGLLLTACADSTDGLGADTVAQWLARYETAWESKDADLAASLFTADATYRETPYADPFRGVDEIRDYWSGVTSDQDDIDFGYEVLAVDGRTGVAQWSARFRSISGEVPLELNGVFVLEFADDNHVESLREWWHLR